MTEFFFTTKKKPQPNGLIFLFAVIALFLWAPGATAEGNVRSIVREELARRFPSSLSTLQEITLTEKQIKNITRENIDARLLKGAKLIDGFDIQSAPNRQELPIQIATLSFAYKDKEAVKNMELFLKKRHGHFQKSKILIRFSHASRANELFIFFTENSGSPEMLELVETLPLQFSSNK